MNKTKITVYIISHNYGKFLQEAIESVLRQTVDNWELLLINDNSSDNTKDVMELYRTDPKIRIFDTGGIGLPGGANFATRESKGEYIIRLDADDVLDENTLLVLGNYLDRHPEVAMVFPDYFLINEHGGIVSHELRESVYRYNHQLDMPANGACTLIRKRILKELGGYREDLGVQDGFDLWTRVLREHKCANVNIPLFYYRRHGNNLTDDNVRILSARRLIKKDACSINLNEHRPIIAVIPCRRHYDIYPDLWSKRLNKKTLLDISIDTCIKSSIFDKVIVTSDNGKVKEIMSKHKDRRLMFMERTRESTANSRSITYTLERIIDKLEIGWKGITVLSYIQAPFTTTASLEENIYTLILNNADSAFAVQEVEDFLYRRNPHGLTPINPRARLRSDFDVIYSEALTSAATKNINIKNGSLTGARISHFILPKEEAFFIRTKRDYEIARILK